MWQLIKTRRDGEWAEDGLFESVNAAARRIRELEGRSEGGVFFSVYAEIDFGSDDEALGRLECTGSNWLYVVKRRIN